HNHPQLMKVRGTQEPSFVSEGEVVFVEAPAKRLPTTPIRLFVTTGERPVIEGGPPEGQGGPAHGRWPVRRGANARRYVVDLPAGIYVAKVPGRTRKFFEVPGESQDVRIEG